VFCIAPNVAPSPFTVNEDATPVVVDESCSLYWPGEVCTAVACTPVPLLLMPAITAPSEPSPVLTVTGLPVPTVIVTGCPPLTTMAEVLETEFAKTDDWALASLVTSKVKAPACAPAAAVAETVDDDDVTVIDCHVVGSLRASDAVWSAAILVLIDW